MGERVVKPFLWLVPAAVLALVTAALSAPTGPRAAADAAGAEFFEREIRPLLISRCQACHGDAQARGGLRLTSRSLILKGGGRGPALVPGRPAQSLLVGAVEYRGDLKMPPAGRLSEREVGLLKRWIVLRAPWPSKAEGGRRKAEGSEPDPLHPSSFILHPSRHWAFQPVREPAVPKVREASRVRSPIDAFILAELEKRGLRPAPPADPRTLIRRATFDLTGLPPTPEEVEQFVRERAAERAGLHHGDTETRSGHGEREKGRVGERGKPASTSGEGTPPRIGGSGGADPNAERRTPNAYERLIDRLLASPAYGVRYARHWLDVVRYADYDDGDPKARTASCEPLQAWRYRDWVVASFNRDLPFDRFIVHQIAGDLLPSPDRQEFYADGLVATTFLSNGSWDRGDADKEKMVSDMVDDQIDTVGKAFLGLTLGCARCHDHKFDPISQKDYYALAGIFYSTHILKDIGAKGGEYTLNRIPLAPKAYVARWEQQLAQLDGVKRELAELDKKMPKPAADDPERLKLAGERERLQAELLPEPPLAEAAQEGGTAGGLFPKVQDVPIHVRGSYTRLGEVVPRRMPAFFAGTGQPPIAAGSGRRELAAWIATKENPLTARVIVNRVWQWHFGAGLERTPNNFGMRSEPPSHPALLDWLAARFVEDGWSLKKLHRRIMLSAAYQVSSGQWSVGSGQRGKAQSTTDHRPLTTDHRSLTTADPENRWLGRFAGRRLEAEAIRDSMLAVAGRLDPAQGGPASADLSVPRRSLYVQTARWDRSTFAMLFDAANPDASEERRNVSTVAPQALFLLNHEFTLTQARFLAERLAREVPDNEAARIQRAYQLLFARPATPAEVRLDREFLSRTRSAGGDAGDAWRDLAHVLLCSNEFVFLD